MRARGLDPHPPLLPPHHAHPLAGHQKLGWIQNDRIRIHDFYGSRSTCTLYVVQYSIDWDPFQFESRK